MDTKNVLYKTCFNHNDVLLDCWYDQVINDNEMLMRSMLQVYSDLNNDEFYSYYDHRHVYETLLDCIIYSEAK